jgi:hypothetical protein
MLWDEAVSAEEDTDRELLALLRAPTGANVEDHAGGSAMTTRRIVYRICNGCHRDEFNDMISIVKSATLGERSVDICFDCEGQGRYICEACRNVNDANEPSCEIAKAKRIPE